MKKRLIDNIYKIFIGIFTIAGFVMRALCCTWGRPYMLHPDEPAIVPYAIDMIKRHSWLVYSYSRPDQLEIKCDALIFQAASLLKYHVSADAAFGDHTFFFYFLARLFTTLTGTLLIPLIALLTWKIFRNEKINARAAATAAAGLTAFSWQFIQHSAYATPDIPLTLFMVIITCLSVDYLQKGRLRDICFIAALNGLAVTIKYPAAIFTAFIALIIIYRAVREKHYLHILTRGALSAVLLTATAFIMAPNLFTDFGSVISAFSVESGSSHLGADGLGFIGNMKYYLSTVWDTFGFISMPAFIIGIIYLVLHRRKEHIALSVSGIYWILLSILPLHWVRWGFPMYVVYIILVSVGCVWLYLLIREYIIKTAAAVCVRTALIIVCTICSISLLLGAVSITVWTLRKDTRVYAAATVNSMGLNNGNCFSEAYTPLTMNGGGGEVDELFELSGNSIRLQEKYAGREYFMTNVSYRNRYLAYPDAYADIIKIYDLIPKQFKCIFTVKGGYVAFARNEIDNIANCISLFRDRSALTGGDIAIYDLNTGFVNIHPFSDDKLSLILSDNNGSSLPALYYGEYDWTEYTADGTETIMSRDNDMVLMEEKSDSGYKVTAGYIEGESDRHWTVTRKNGFAYIVSSQGMALADRDGHLTLEKFDGSDPQKWIFEAIE